MAFMRRSLRLTTADVERVNALRLRSGVNVSFSDVFVAALVHYRAQHPLADAVMEPLNAQLMRDTVENGDDAKVTSFSLLHHEADTRDDLARTSRLTRRLSKNALVRLAVLVFSFASNEVVRSTCLTLPPRPRPGPRPRSFEKVV